MKLVSLILMLFMHTSFAAPFCSAAKIKAQIDGLMGYVTPTNRPILVSGFGGIGLSIISDLNQTFWPGREISTLRIQDIENQPIAVVVRMVQLRHGLCK